MSTLEKIEVAVGSGTEATKGAHVTAITQVGCMMLPHLKIKVQNLTVHATAVILLISPWARAMSFVDGMRALPV